MNTNEMLGTETILIKEEFKNNDTIDLGDYLPQSPLHSLQTTGTEVTPPSEGQIKCGEIFIINEKFKYVCYYCGYIDEDSDNFENHIFMEHYIFNKNNIQIGNECMNRKFDDGEEVSDNKDSIISRKLSTCRLALTDNQYKCKKPQYDDGEEENDNKDPLTSQYLSNLDLINNANKNDNKTNDDTNNKLLDATDKLFCEFCERDFETDSQYKNHFKHFRKQQNFCTICQKQTCGSKQFMQHMSFVHNIENKASPDLEYTERKQKPSRKINLPYNKIQTICDYCDKDLITNQQYRTHLTRYRNHRNICTICEKQTCGSKQFMDHMSSVHDIENIKPPSSFKQPLKKKETKHKPSRKINLPYNKIQTICDYCDKDLITNFQYRRHLTRFRNRRNICTICQKQTCGSQQFIEHNSSVHNIKNIKSPRTLKKPLKNKIIKKARRKGYSCDLCNFVCKDSTSLYIHKWKHTGVRPHVCKFCNKSFILSSVKRLHERRYHTGEKPFQCSECGKCFPYLRVLNMHFRSVHLKHKRISEKCTICSKVLVSKAHLEKHINDVHRDDRPFVCDICQKSFKTRKTLNEHKKIHSGKKSYECNYCGQKFFQSSGRRGHIRRVHEEKEIS